MSPSQPFHGGIEPIHRQQPLRPRWQPPQHALQYPPWPFRTRCGPVPLRPLQPMAATDRQRVRLAINTARHPIRSFHLVQTKQDGLTWACRLGAVPHALAAPSPLRPAATGSSITFATLARASLDATFPVAAHSRVRPYWVFTLPAWPRRQRELVDHRLAQFWRDFSKPTLHVLSQSLDRSHDA